MNAKITSYAKYVEVIYNNVVSDTGKKKSIFRREAVSELDILDKPDTADMVRINFISGNYIDVHFSAIDEVKNLTTTNSNITTSDILYDELKLIMAE